MSTLASSLASRHHGDRSPTTRSTGSTDDKVNDVSCQSPAPRKASPPYPPHTPLYGVRSIVTSDVGVSAKDKSIAPSEYETVRSSTNAILPSGRTHSSLSGEQGRTVPNGGTSSQKLSPSTNLI